MCGGYGKEYHIFTTWIKEGIMIYLEGE